MGVEVRCQWHQLLRESWVRFREAWDVPSMTEMRAKRTNERLLRVVCSPLFGKLDQVDPILHYAEASHPSLRVHRSLGAALFPV